MAAQTVTHHGIKFNSKILEKFCLKNGIIKLSLYGSVLRDNFSMDSDIDVLVEFMPGEQVTLFNIIDMEEELSEIFGGRKVDLRTREDLSRYFREKVVTEAEVQFAR